MASASSIADSLFSPPAAAQPLKVLHVVNGEFYAGAERVQDLLAMRLPDFGFEVGFACLKPGKFPAARQSQRSPLTAIPMRGKWDLRAPREVARLARREGYSLIHAHTPRSLLVGRFAAALAGVPLVYHIHSQTTTEIDQRWTCRLNALTERLCLSGAAAVITVSPSARSFALRQRIRGEILRLVPNGIPSRGPLSPKATPSGPWTIGTVALFRPRKGLETLLEAVAQLRRDHHPVELRAVGPFETESYEREVHHRADQLGLCDCVTWTGFTRDVPAELARMDLFAFPSLLAEGMPMVLLEAMSNGVPIVASRVEGVTDLLGEDGQSALLTRPGDAAALADEMARVMRGERDWQALRAAAARRQAECYSDDSMARSVAQVYREVLSA